LKEAKAEGLRWLRQAENDQEYAQLGLREGFFAQVCFQCQQICEKALKAIHYGQLGKRVVFGHSLVQLAARCPALRGIQAEAGRTGGGGQPANDRAGPRRAL